MHLQRWEAELEKRSRTQMSLLQMSHASATILSSSESHLYSSQAEAHRITMEMPPLKTVREMSHKLCIVAQQAADVLI